MRKYIFLVINKIKSAKIIQFIVFQLFLMKLFLKAVRLSFQAVTPISYYKIPINNFSTVENIFLKSMRLSFQETNSMIKYKILSSNMDKSWLYTFIKKRAHHLEKRLFFPKKYVDKVSNELNYNQLKNALIRWNDSGYLLTSSVKWAQKILFEYKKYFPEGCPRYIRNEKIENKHHLNTRNLMNLIKERRSRRIFLDIPLTDEEKKLLVEAALYAPSSCNRQSIRLIFIENPKIKKFIIKNVPGGRDFLENAPCIILLISDKRDYRFPEDKVIPYQDSGAAIQNILLLAETMGLGCCWCSFTSYGNIINEKEIYKKLNIPEFFLITGAVAIGHKGHNVCFIPRDNPEEKYSTNKFHW